MNKEIDLGNNEKLSKGVFMETDKYGNVSFLALGFTKSKTFKTEKGALSWLKRVSK